MARDYVWQERRYMNSIQGNTGSELLRVGPIEAGTTLERIIVDLHARFPNVDGTVDASNVTSFAYMQAITVTLDDVTVPPQFPLPLDFATNMVGRDFLYLGAHVPVLRYGHTTTLRIKDDYPLHVDVATRRTPEPGFEHRVWWQWAVDPQFDITQHNWRGTVSVLLSTAA